MMNGGDFMKKIENIYVLCGAVSVEHEISLMSAKNILNNLNKEKYKVYPVYISKDGKWFCHERLEKEIEDQTSLIKEVKLSREESIGKFLSQNYDSSKENFFIPCIHGTYGEDGVIQGFLEVLGVPYLGSGVLASSSCMDKSVTNEVLEQNGMPKAKNLAVIDTDYAEDKDSIIEKIENKIPYPIYVKPANAGSSVGVTRATDRESLIKAIEIAFEFDSKIVIEEQIFGRELEVAVIGNDDPIASLPGEHVVEGHDFFDYESKYFDKKTVIKAPTEVTKDQEDRVRRTAVKAYKLMGCKGIARVDIFMRESDEEMLVNEINTFPGMTGTSLAPMLWKPTMGLGLDGLLEKLMEYALEEYQEKNEKKRSFN